ncbi:uncharacterized protein L969DRAFT_95575 [Mixia osmundae IAM 14324]|uniref:Uncharacterized protein n=1 Tax=Mixia osmundae (strain CBS 9802 / IAM 14324 / JCM 22182 / KY 12970) TaxID=764103 RepID=G7E7T7_MIXOS|nr:uncharacterized protein L969DRAFT_95575 [Mixia osmundae IAM 14324]KEI38498.1 hypothetical protein L969DRAFT_95575 [Mixia osmundae IAM 14324]GAA98897.1 hypothetical protein E5Q_05585 [Mixia osmundae IAM 14324]
MSDSNHRATNDARQDGRQAGEREARQGPTALLAELAPRLMTRRIINSPSFNAALPNNSAGASSAMASAASQSAALTLRTGQTVANSLARLNMSGKKAAKYAYASNSTELRILEGVDELLALPIPPAPAAVPSVSAGYVSLLRGFQATQPSASVPRMRRRKRRAGLIEYQLGLSQPDASQSSLGLKQRGERARGLLAAPDGETSFDGSPSSRGAGHHRRSQQRHLRAASRGNLPDANLPRPSREELEAEVEEILADKENVDVRRSLLTHEIDEVERKIASLDQVRQDLRRGLLGLREEQLELDDELEGLRERLAQETLSPTANGRSLNAPASSRRRKGPAFLPSEHDELPPNVAFMTLAGHHGAITALDFSEPYGTLVTASADETVKLWDLTTGEEYGSLSGGHSGVVKALQVESNLCVSGSKDGRVCIWDLDRIEEVAEGGFPKSSSIPFGNGGMDGDHSFEDAIESQKEAGGGLVKVLDGHTKDVTSLYFDGGCLVTGSSDKTLRQWDMKTGQCVLTMDILWAISNPDASQSLSASPPASPPQSDTSSFPSMTPGHSPYTSPYTSPAKPGLSRPGLSSSYQRKSSYAQSFAAAIPPMSDGSWDLYQDFVGACQFWGVALASGSADGCVRMWDMRTGQAHRTLVGHTAPVTSLQFDELHLISGSLDKTVRVWDLRTGAVAETLRYDHAVSALQFDTRKIVVAAGENAIKVYNRTTLQQTSLLVNGHTSPAERLRFMDRYLATGSRDATVKVWSLG